MTDETHELDRDLAELRPALHAHCYRLAGNVADADDLVQETLLRAWRARAGFEGRASVSTWLHRIATNVFLDRRKSAAARTHPTGDAFEWATDLGPYPDALVAGDELVELALIAALQFLPTRQRAAFVLRDVMGWAPAEIGEALGVPVSAANSLLQRARETMRRRAPERPEDWRRPELTPADEELLRRYAAAVDPAEFRELLAADVRITMPPDEPVVGRDTVAAFLGRPLDWRTVATSANGRPALVSYLRREGAASYVGQVVDVLDIRDGRIAAVHAFVGPQHVAAFGLPLELTP
jgi:RNA polymerase sigma-70 factor (ECF subfamily)